MVLRTRKVSSLLLPGAGGRCHSLTSVGPQDSEAPEFIRPHKLLYRACGREFAVPCVTLPCALQSSVCGIWAVT
jgi:hypothetical protein